MEFLTHISSDDYYILLNKLELLHGIANTTNTTNTLCHFQILIDEIISNTNINYHRLMHNSKSREIIINIWKKIYNNNIFNYDGDFDKNKFKIINNFELIYDDTDYNHNNDYHQYLLSWENDQIKQKTINHKQNYKENIYGYNYT